jgi:two-component system cell cycle sensor histidine kinase/response regulator CckA
VHGRISIFMAKKQQSNKAVVRVELRALAEERLKINQLNNLDDSASPEEILRMNHELAVHQIELEMQQDELLKSKAELEISYGRYAELFDFAPLGYLTLDRESRILEANLTASTMLGVAPSLLQGILFKAYVVPEDYAVVDALIEQVFTERVPGHIEIRLLAGNTENPHTQSALSRRTFRIDAALHNADYGCRVILSDISDQKQSEYELRRITRALRAINLCNQSLLQITDEEELLEKICSIMVEIGDYQMAWVGYAEKDTNKIIRPVAQAGFEEGYLNTMQFTWADFGRGRGPAGKSIRTGQPAVNPNMLTDPDFEPWRKEAIARGYASVMSLPLKAENEAFGCLCIYSSMPDAFDTEETQLLTALADNLAYGVFMLRTRKAHADAEVKLQESESRYRSLFQNNHTVMLIIDQQDGTIVDANPAATSYYGWTHAELCRMNIKQINQMTEEEVQAEMQRASAEQHNYFLFRHLLADGSLRDVEVHSGPISIEHKSLLYSLVIDITDRKQAESQLIETHKRFTQALEAAHAGVWEVVLETNENIWSDEIWELYGLERGDNKPSHELWEQSVHPFDRERVFKDVTDAVNKEAEIVIEYRINRSDGALCWLLVHGKPFFDEKGHLERYIGTGLDITERKSLEDRLLESHARFSFMLEKSKLGGWDLDLQDKTAHRTLIHDRIFGYESLLPKWTYEMFIDHVLPEDRTEVDRKFHEAIENQIEWNFECRIRRTDGEIRWIWAIGDFQHNNTGKASRMSGIVTDITERKLLEEERAGLQMQLNQAQKMQMVGQLAGGIAHDFNNMLTVILGHTELALYRKDSSYDDLKTIEKAATHSAELTGQLLAFARRQRVSVRIFDLNASIEKMLSILRHLIGEHITIIWRPKVQGALVKLDPSQIDQIIVNLCVNSRDAISGNGTITIETNAIHVDQARINAGHPCVIPGDYITLSITDNGQGIDKQDLPHIIEPFFTTKEVGKGTGMGLATVYGIVKQGNGCLDVKSEKGKGTSIIIYLPLQREQKLPVDGTTEESVLPQEKGMILLVEDQPDILQLCSKMLEDQGYSVFAASNPLEAIEYAEQKRGNIDLLVTDVIMPEMNGNELFKKIEPICPKLHVLYMSGYTADFIAQHLQSDAKVNFIEKPFIITAFKKTVQEMMKKKLEE